jgi:hypothetical protein
MRGKSASAPGPAPFHSSQERTAAFPPVEKIQKHRHAQPLKRFVRRIQTLPRGPDLPDSSRAT